MALFKFRREKLKIGILGCGAIGSVLAKAIDKDISGAKVVAIEDSIKKKANVLAAQLKSKPKVVSFNKLIGMSDLVIEAAGKEFVKVIAEVTFSKGKDLMCMSVGGVHQGLLDVAEQCKCNVYIPSGAIAGLDAVKAAANGKIKSVTLVTTKPPKSLSGYENVKVRKVVYSGDAMKAVELFPKNINVSAALSLAGIGFKKTKVKIIVDPSVKRNIHEIVVEGDFGKITTKTENKPSPLNPKTSYLAVLSAIAMVKRIVGKVEIGS
ncbi:aspartate dehydrogenase [Candidatus Woesearchaeota archaeon]|jgi:aspartate dehydrogenase|nr:aspartate dehydrogenase [Candidatus Woesearchaeota archaeon]MBT5272817.1 aspartate dehydrogenase [Candidatus Woesearchaeota archaeon]MBT6040429.1 aspartate dehydrogenase [Candidatus Woesearchaeota archaeon]MBT6336938.1 aspartate dehydrogenase [Candidatus Woesearchaeota archaeon]MBT7926824.1 aspartate dehydrogenase [Candidatus Woesearchaeota archaeon]